MGIDMLMLGIGLAGLFVGGEWLVRGAARLAESMGIPALVIGLTVVAFGTSTPELVVSASAALRHEPEIALGNVLGSNVANIALILGVAALIRPIRIDIKLIKREIPIMIGVSILVFLFALNQRLGRLEGLILMLGYFAFNLWIYYDSRQGAESVESVEAEAIAELESEVEMIEGQPSLVNRRHEALRLAAGLVILIIGAELTVRGAVSIAESFKVDSLLIGITIVAIGTSLPELVTSVVASYHGHDDIAVGNVVGSNIANLLMILGVTSFLKPISVERSLMSFEFPAVLAFAFLLVPFALNRQIGKRAGSGFLAAYLAFTVLLMI